MMAQPSPIHIHWNCNNENPVYCSQLLIVNSQTRYIVHLWERVGVVCVCRHRINNQSILLHYVKHFFVLSYKKRNEYFGVWMIWKNIDNKKYVKFPSIMQENWGTSWKLLKQPSTLIIQCVKNIILVLGSMFDIAVFTNLFDGNAS